MKSCKIAILVGLLSLSFAMLAGGCSAERYCKKYCGACEDGFDEWDTDWDTDSDSDSEDDTNAYAGRSCKSACIDVYEDGDYGCRRALRSVARCVDRSGCDTSCVVQMTSFFSNCGVIDSDWLW